jgi:hypothetical protein
MNNISKKNGIIRQRDIQGLGSEQINKTHYLEKGCLAMKEGGARQKCKMAMVVMGIRH